MSVHLINVLFMGSMAVAAAVLAAVLAVVIDRWWAERGWRKDMEDAEKSAPLAAEILREDERNG